MMQKIFSQEVRFRDDDGEFEEWEEKRFSNLFLEYHKKNLNNLIRGLIVGAFINRVNIILITISVSINSLTVKG